MTTAKTAVILVAAALALACGGRSGLPPDQPPVEKGPGGDTYHVVDKGAYKAYYDQWGRLARIEHDSNGDGRPDQIAHHEGGKTARLIELDLDFDGGTDRWEYYDGAGALEKIGVARKGSVPDRWTYPVEGGHPGRVEYDEDGDGRIDRTEILREGRLHRLELDVDRDGRPDRWQEWEDGRLIVEALDTDGDGEPDRRIKFGEKGRVVGLEPIPSE